MGEDTSFEELLGRLRKRDNAAATHVFNRFQRRLIILAYSHLDKRLLPKIDPEDVVQSVFQTVFNRLADGQFDLGDWDSLWGLLTRITVRKCEKWRDHFHTHGRDVDREVLLPPAAGECEPGWEFIDREPTPAEALALAEAVQQVMRGLNDREQQVVRLKLQGFSLSEISEQIPCNYRKVRSVLDHVRGRLERMRDEGAQKS